MPGWVRGLLAALVVLIVAGVPFAAFRAQYAHTKRLREVAAGRFYRSGQFTADGLRQTVERYGIRTVINLQHENPDPHLPDRWMGKPKVRESELCKALGVRYVLLTPDVLPPGNTVDRRPPVVDEYLKVLDDPAAYPVLIHCKAGLHRTGRLTAIYRMEYEGWSVGSAVRELRANGFGYTGCTEGDDFVVQFVQNYKPRPKATAAAVSPAEATDPGRTEPASAVDEAEGGRP